MTHDMNLNPDALEAIKAVRYSNELKGNDFFYCILSR